VNDLQHQVDEKNEKTDVLFDRRYPLNLKMVISDLAILFGIAGFIVFLDRITKEIVRQSLGLGESWMPLEWLAPYARIVHWRNSGAAFGMFQNGGMIFTGLAIIVSIFIIFYFPQVPKEEWALRLAMGMQLGGALGNLLDRLLLDGFVTDFISVGSFPVFNIADSSIFIGVCVLIVGVWISEKKVQRESEEVQLSD
jgi:signal peptidase II